MRLQQAVDLGGQGLDGHHHKRDLIGVWIKVGLTAGGGRGGTDSLGRKQMYQSKLGVIRFFGGERSSTGAFLNPITEEIIMVIKFLILVCMCFSLTRVCVCVCVSI